MIPGITWQPRSRDELVIENLIDLIMKANAAKQIMMFDKHKNKKFIESSVDQFYSHLEALYDLAMPIIGSQILSKLKKPKETLQKDGKKGRPKNWKVIFDFNKKYNEIFHGELERKETIADAILFWRYLTIRLNECKIWSIKKEAQISEAAAGERSVYGI